MFYGLQMRVQYITDSHAGKGVCFCFSVVHMIIPLYRDENKKYSKYSIVRLLIIENYATLAMVKTFLARNGCVHFN